MRRLSALRERDERGAVVVLMAAFSLVIVGMAALVVDVGAIHDEKRQLQNGADSAALGLARLMAATCPMGTPACTASTLSARAQELVDANARDRLTTVDAVKPDYAAKTITVLTSTKEAGGSGILPYQFAQILTGAEGQTVRAAATASWAGLRTAPVIRLTLSRCEFIEVTAGGTVFDVPREILFHGRTTVNCPGQGAGGANLPGGFGWLDDDNDGDPYDCHVTLDADSTVGSDPGNDNPQPCHIGDHLGEDVLLALFDNVSNSGTNGSYHVYGFAQFHITGFRFPSGGDGGASCPTNACIAGHFIRFVPVGELGGPNLGDRVALVS